MNRDVLRLERSDSLTVHISFKGDIHMQWTETLVSEQSELLIDSEAKLNSSERLNGVNDRASFFLCAYILLSSLLLCYRRCGHCVWQYHRHSSLYVTLPQFIVCNTTTVRNTATVWGCSRRLVWFHQCTAEAGKLHFMFCLFIYLFVCLFGGNRGI